MSLVTALVSVVKCHNWCPRWLSLTGRHPVFTDWLLSEVMLMPLRRLWDVTACYRSTWTLILWFAAAVLLQFQTLSLWSAFIHSWRTFVILLDNRVKIILWTAADCQFIECQEVLFLYSMMLLYKDAQNNNFILFSIEQISLLVTDLYSGLLFNWQTNFLVSVSKMWMDCTMM